MSQSFASYMICATPRSGSTLLCTTLAVTGVAGRPQSFFRPANVVEWADAWGVSRGDGIESVDFNRRLLAAMRREGGAYAGAFGLRLMWDHLPEAARRLASALGHEGDPALLLSEAFGPPLWIHLSRADTVAQAVSRLRAERTGLWHRAADGTVIEEVPPTGPVAYDYRRIAEIETELRHDEAAWSTFFATRGIVPLALTYESIAANPRIAVAAILEALCLDPASAADVPIPTARLADDVSRAWIDRFRRETGR